MNANLAVTAIAPSVSSVFRPRLSSVHTGAAALRRSPILSAFSPAALSALAQQSVLRSFSTYQTVLSKGRTPAGPMLVVKGRVRAVRMVAGGRELTLDCFGPGDLIMDGLSTEDGSVETGFAALETSLLLFLPREEFWNQLKQQPDVAFGMMRDMEKRHERVRSLALGLAMDEVDVRLYRLLGTWAREFGQPNPEGIVVDRCPAQHEIANRIGSRRETVSRMLAELVRQNFIRIEGRRLVLFPRFMAMAVLQG